MKKVLENKKYFLFLNFSLVFFVLFYFWDVLANPNGVIIGKIGDATNSYIPWLEATRLGNTNRSSFFDIQTKYFSFPEGETLVHLTDIVSSIPRLALLTITLITNSSIFSQNILIFIIFFFNYFAFYRLMLKLKVDINISTIFSFLFTFSHYHQVKLLEHLSLLNSWIVVIFLYWALSFLHDRKYSHLLKMNILFVLAFYIETYYILMLFLIIAALIIVIVNSNLTQYLKMNRKFLSFSIFFSIISLFPLLYIYTQNTDQIAGTFRTSQDLVGFSAKFSYLLTPNPSNPYLRNLHLPSSSNYLAGLESVHFSFIQIFIIVIYILVSARNFRFIANYILKIRYVFLLITLVLSFLIVIPINFEIFSWNLASPYFYFYQFFPHWRVTSRFLELTSIVMMIFSALIINSFYKRISLLNRFIFIILFFTIVSLNVGVNTNWKAPVLKVQNKLSEYIKANTLENATILYTENTKDRYFSHIDQILHNRRIANNVLNNQSLNPIYRAMSPNDVQTPLIMNRLGIDFLVFKSTKLYTDKDFTQLKLVKNYYNSTTNNYEYLLKPYFKTKSDSSIVLGSGFYSTNYELNSGTWNSSLISNLVLKDFSKNGDKYLAKLYIFSRRDYEILMFTQNGKILNTSTVYKSGSAVEFCADKNSTVSIISQRLTPLNFDNRQNSSDSRLATFFITGLESSKC